MTPSRLLAFGPFAVDLDGEQLLRGGQPIPLRPKTWAVLRYFVERPGRLVTKAELLDSVWADVTVGDELPGVSVAELRTALGDDVHDARFIATVHRRGYRFVGTVAAVAPPPGTAPSPGQRPSVVGRDAELARLRGWLDEAVAGSRRVTFVSGEPGIGKTTLVEAFLAGGAFPPATRIARGHCLPVHGESEPFLPVTEAIARLCAAPGGDRMVEVLRRHAPLWLPHVGGAVDAGERDALAHDARGATPELMVRRLVEALEAMATDAPLVLLLEDLQWSDPSTVDVLGRLEFRPEPARLLLIGTYRPAEVVARRHALAALRQHLRLRQRWHEIVLDFLPEAPVAAFLSARFPGAVLPDGLSAWLLRRSDGNPLFMIHVAQALCAEGLARPENDRWTVAGDFQRVGIPDSLRELLDQQIQTLPRALRAALEAASIVGPTFSAAAVAAAIETDVAAAEDACETAARRTHLVRRDGDASWPDGTVAGRYGFVHELYREALEGSVPPARRAALHRRIAERLETAWGARTIEIAGDLATHFERAGDATRAVFHHQRAAEQALARHAPREGLMHLDAALRQLEHVPASPERTQRMIYVLVARGATLTAAEGHTAPVVGETFERTRALCAPGDETPQMVQVLGGLSTFHRLRGDVPRALRYGEETLALAERLGGLPLLVAGAQVPLAGALLLAGEVTRAHALGEAAAALFSSLPELPPLEATLTLDPHGAALAHVALSSTLVGHPDESSRHCEAALTRSRAAGDLVPLFATLLYVALVHVLRRDPARVHALAAETMALAADPSLRMFEGSARAFRGHAFVEEGCDGAVAELAQAIEQLRAADARMGEPYHLGVLATAHAKRGDADTALRVMGEAFRRADETGERLADAELHRLHARILLLCDPAPQRRRRRTPVPAAEAALGRAVSVARAQGARWLELRAARDLARLQADGGRETEARAVLRAALDGYPATADLPDLREAFALQRALAPS